MPGERKGAKTKYEMNGGEDAKLFMLNTSTSTRKGKNGTKNLTNYKKKIQNGNQTDTQ